MRSPKAGETVPVDPWDCLCRAAAGPGGASKSYRQQYFGVGCLGMVPTTMAEAVCPEQVRTISWIVSFDEAAQREAWARFESLD